MITYFLKPIQRIKYIKLCLTFYNLCVLIKKNNEKGVGVVQQLNRIKWTKEYMSHPLRKEYEAEKRKLKKACSPIKRLLYLLLLIPGAPFVLLLIALLDFGTAMNAAGPLGYIFVLGIEIAILYGIIRLYGWIKEEIDDGKPDPAEYKKLREKYHERGLYEHTKKELFDSRCAELDDYDNWVCGITGELLSADEINWCYSKGNCKYCSKFVNAYAGTTQGWIYPLEK